MSNVLTLPARSGRSRTGPSGPAADLSRLADDVARIGLMSFENTADLKQAILLLGLFNARARQLIGSIDDLDCRSRLLAEADRIGALVEIAGRKAADL